jgi:ribosomal protein S18 acetylase RimI-like enzyme
VSNFLRRSGGSPPPANCRPARAQEIHPALRLILGSASALADSEQAFEFITFAHQRGINLGDLWVAERDSRLIWSVLPIISPGRTVLLLSPAGAPRDPAAGHLIDTVCRRAATQGVQLAQALLDPAEPGIERLFADRGFLRMAELLYLQGAVRGGAARALPEGFAWEAYSPASHGLFASTIVDSYRDSLDCPGLNGIRDIEDVLAGHKSSGQFDPQYWFVLREGARGRGALLLSKLPNTDSAEMVYLGLAPESRRRGMANLLMQQAFEATAAMGQSRLSLAVDSGNLPALQLYYRHGLSKVASKIAMMKELVERDEGTKGQRDEGTK